MLDLHLNRHMLIEAGQVLAMLGALVAAVLALSLLVWKCLR